MRKAGVLIDGMLVEYEPVCVECGVPTDPTVFCLRCRMKFLKENGWLSPNEAKALREECERLRATKGAEVPP